MASSVYSQPNRLGRALGYVTSSIAYARLQLRAEEKQRRIVMDFLSKMSGTGNSVTIDSSRAELLAITSYAVFTAIRLIGSRVGAREAWPQAMIRSGETLAAADNHPFEKLLRWPNDIMSYGYIARYCTGWYLLRGAAYIFISTPKIGRGEPQELWPLPSNLITPRPDTLRRSNITNRMVMDYFMTVEGRKHPLPGENVMRVRFPNWWDYWDGLSSLTGSISAIRTDANQAQWEQDFYGEDNAVPTAILSLPADMSDLDYETAKEAIKEQFGKGRASAVTRAGDLTVEVIQQTLEEMQIRLSREFNRDQIYQVMGVPLGLVTGELGVDNMYAVLVSFAQNTLQPILDDFAGQWTIAGRPYYGDEFEARAPNVVPQDRSLEVQEYAIYGQDNSINENRASRGKAPVDFGVYTEIPVRLLSILFRGGGGHPFGDEEAGTMIGAESPEQMVNRLSDDGLNTEELAERPEDQGEHGDEAKKAAVVVANVSVDTRALITAMKSELRAWRKVAVKQIEKGDNVLDRDFATAVLSDDLVRSLRDVLGDAKSVSDVKVIFEYAMANLDKVFEDD